VLTLEHCLDDLAYLNDGANGNRRPPLTHHAIDQAVTRAGSMVGAARLLGVDRATIYRFLRHASAGRDTRMSVADVSHAG
jgi:transcriptional regulator of acetoin/glycerol metabolism